MTINALPKNVLLMSLFLLNASVQAATVSVYGAEQGARLTSSRQANNEYLIQMGSFKNKQYATEYRDRLSQKTNQTVHLVYYADASVPYSVFLGPFKNLGQVNQTSRELLGEQKSVRLPVSLPLNPEPTVRASFGSPRKTSGNTPTKATLENNALRSEYLSIVTVK